MGNSLSQDSQTVLEAATAGDAGLLKQQIACEPKLLESVTLLKRRGVLHLAAKSGHSHVISTVLEPLLDAVRQEYYAVQEREHGEDSEGEQQEAAAAPAAPEGAGEPQPAQEQEQEQEQVQVRRRDSQDPPAGRQEGQQPPREQRHPAADAQQQQQQQQQQQRARAVADGAGGAGGAQQAPEVQLVSFKRLRQTVNARDLYRRTPLIVAAKRGHLDCTQLLVEAASNLFAVDREGNTSLHYAALHGHAEVLEYLLQRASDRGLSTRFVNKRNLSGFTPLHYAVWSCRVPVVVPLLAAGADITAANDRVFDAWVPVPIGSTPLHLAVMRASSPVALLLLQHYAAMLAAAPSGRTRPADPRGAVNLYGMNPAQLAAHRNNRPLAQLLMPSLSLSRVLQVAAPDMVGTFGPPTLRAIAAAVVNQHLEQQLDSLAAAAQQQQEEDGSDKAGGSSCCCAASSACGAGSKAAEARARHPVVSVAAGASPQPLLSPSASTDTDQPDLEILQDDSAPSSRSGSPASPAGQQRCGDSFCQRAGKPGAGGGDAKLARAQTQASSSGWYDELCCVCWESEVTAALQPCSHALCMDCARQLVSCGKASGVTCPLCRAYIAGFGQVPPPAHAPGAKKGFLLSGSGI